MQEEIKKYGDKSKILDIKEMYNIITKNSCFSKLKYTSLIEEIIREAVLLLVFMTVKRNGEIKSRRVVNRSF